MNKFKWIVSSDSDFLCCWLCVLLIDENLVQLNIFRRGGVHQLQAQRSSAILLFSHSPHNANKLLTQRQFPESDAVLLAPYYISQLYAWKKIVFSSNAKLLKFSWTCHKVVLAMPFWAAFLTQDLEFSVDHRQLLHHRPRRRNARV